MKTRLQLAMFTMGLAAACTAVAQVDPRNVPLMPNGLPTDIDTLTRPNTDPRPYSYQPPTVYGRPNAAPPYYERRYYGDRPTAPLPSPAPLDRSRELTPFETRSLYGTPTQPRWDVPARPLPPVRAAPKADAKKPEPPRSPGADKLPDATPD